MKLCLGTVQFGMDYGLAKTKAMKIDEAVKCISFAVQNGVTAIDTSPAYGYAESIVGEYIKTSDIARDNIYISDKLYPALPDNLNSEEYEKEINNRINESLEKLNTDYIDAYIYHTSEYALNNELLKALFSVKEKGKAKKIGVSVYTPEEALACCYDEYADFLQLPYSVFDRRMKVAGVFGFPEKMTIHARSVFVQGLLFMPENELPYFLSDAKSAVTRYHELCKEYCVSESALAMGYVKQNAAISAIVFGAVSEEQIKSNIDAFNTNMSKELLDKAEKEFHCLDEAIYLPTLWNK